MTNHGLEAAKRQIGKRRDEVPTPALLLDLPKARQNIAEMANRMATVPAALRPHVKIHKNPGLGKNADRRRRGRIDDRDRLGGRRRWSMRATPAS